MATEKKYLVVWKIDIWADNPEEAATRALIIQRDPDSEALNFEVTAVVDLDTDYGDE